MELITYNFGLIFAIFNNQYSDIEALFNWYSAFQISLGY